MAKPQQSSMELSVRETGDQEDKASLPAGDGARTDPVIAHPATEKPNSGSWLYLGIAEDQHLLLLVVLQHASSKNSVLGGGMSLCSGDTH